LIFQQITVIVEISPFDAQTRGQHVARDWALILRLSFRKERVEDSDSKQSQENDLIILAYFFLE
jgi:hypothetical protein